MVWLLCISLSIKRKCFLCVVKPLITAEHEAQISTCDYGLKRYSYLNSETRNDCTYVHHAQEKDTV